jgi:hypothetical protein
MRDHHPSARDAYPLLKQPVANRPQEKPLLILPRYSVLDLRLFGAQSAHLFVFIFLVFPRSGSALSRYYATSISCGSPGPAACTTRVILFQEYLGRIAVCIGESLGVFSYVLRFRDMLS